MTPPSTVTRIDTNTSTDSLDPQSGIIESEFLKKFRAKFTTADAGTPAWPRQSVNTPAEFASEFTAVFRSMFLLLEDDEVPAAGPAKSAKQMIKELIEETGWPDGTMVPVPDAWKLKRYRAFRRYEISASIAILMEIYNSLGPGGDPSGYPPQRPN